MKLASILVFSLLGALGCSSSSSSGSDAASSTTDTIAATGTDTAPGAADTIPASGGCNFPSCMQGLGSVCIPSGACTSEIGTGSMKVCYENGFGFVTKMNADGSFSIALSNGNTACYTGTATPTGTAVSYTLKNPAGATVATVTQSLATGATSVTCSNGETVQLDPACWGQTGCALGTCP